MEIKLPKNWKWATFGEVCNKIGDIDHKMPKQLSTGYPYVSTKDFTDDLKISFNNTKYISKEDYLNLSRKIKPERGDIIFPRYGTIGKNILVDFDKEFLVSYSCAVIKPNHSLIQSKYLYLYSLSPKIGNEIKKYTVETTQANVGIASIKSFIVPLPPLPEQQAIVAKIEALLSELDNGKQQLLTAQQQLKVYRQSLLKWAFEGKLTNKNVKEGELPKMWKKTTLGKVISISSGSGLSRNKRNDDGEYLVYGGNGITGKHSEYLFEDEQLIIGRVGVHCGNAYITKPKSWVTDNAFIVAYDELEVSKNFLLHLIKILNLNKYSVSTAQPVISQGKLYPIGIAIPTIKEQQLIVDELESKLTVCDKIEETISQSLLQAETLRQSVLKMAFEGRLV